MPIIKNNKVMQDIYYEGLKIRKVYCKGILVYEDKIYAVILCQWLKEQEVRYEKEISADWQSWEDERSRLYGVLSDAESSLSSYKSREPPKERETAAHKQWQSTLDRLEGQLADAQGKMDAAKTKWDNAADTRRNRLIEVRDAWKAYETHHANPPSKTIQIDNPKWTEWEKARLAAVEPAAKAEKAHRDYYDNTYSPVLEEESRLWTDQDNKKKAYDNAVNAGAPESVTGPLKAAYEQAHSTWETYYNGTYTSTVAEEQRLFQVSQEADRAYYAWIDSHPEPPKKVTVDNPEYDKWVEEDAKLKSTAETLDAAYKRDESSLNQAVEDAHSEWDQWRKSVDWINGQITTHKANEPTKYETNPDWTTWNNGLPSYEQAVRNAQSNYDSWYNKQPEKYIDVPYTYFRYISKATLDAPTNKPYSTYVNVYFNYGSGVTSSFRLDRNTKSKTIYSQWYKQLSLDSCSVSVTSSKGESDRASLRVNEQWTSRPLEL